MCCSTVGDVLDCGLATTAAAPATPPRMRHPALRTPLAFAAASIALAVAHAAPPAQPAPAGAASRPAAVPSAAAPTKPLADACPAQLPVRQTVSDAIDGWTPLNQQGNYPFVRVAFYPGPPTETGLIVPTAEFRGQAGLHDRWELPRRDGGYWMTCAYANTSATLARKLADDVDFCLADYDGRFMTLVVKHWSCGAKRLMPAATWERPPARPVKPTAKASTGRRAG